ncbi:MAG: phosphodiesterase [Crocinitomicaceae bacterium]|nr:phosphodiesterase [Crocinitomicaceae bacterium]
MKKILLSLLLPASVWAQTGAIQRHDMSHVAVKQSHHAQRATAYNPDLRPFYHGVASGDPLTDRVIIWTRVTPDSSVTATTISGTWKMATDTGLTNIVEQGTFTTDTAADYTVKVDVTGLSAGTTYYYNFTVDGRNSLTGRTKTLPTGSPDHLRFAVVSCSNYEAGFFNGFGRIAERNDLDAVIHLGDYIYEYEHGAYGDTTLATRNHENFETVTLPQYRSRYSLYRLDEDLMRAHQQQPFICVWDDHESSNDSYKDGAENHDAATEGAWADRKAASKRAYFEWIPIREGASESIYRNFEYGDLANLVMLDTRLEGREEQILDVTDPNMYAPNRTMLGDTQHNWFTNELDQSTQKWKLIGNQVIFAQLQVGFAGALTGQTAAEVESMFLDIWDGYPAERLNIIHHIDDNNIDNVVFLTGDFHSTFAFDIADTVVDENNYYAPVANYDASTGAGSQAVEFATPSITSANFDENLDAASAAYLEAQINTALPSPYPPYNPNPHMKYTDLDRHGYFILDVLPDSVTANWYFVDSINISTAGQAFASAWRTRDGENHLVQSVESAEKTVQDTPAPDQPQQSSTGVEEQENIAVFNVYPNPVNEMLSLQLGVNTNEVITIQVVGLRGEILQNRQQEMGIGIYDLQFDFSNYPVGTYFVVLKGNNWSQTEKVIKQ